MGALMFIAQVYERRKKRKKKKTKRKNVEIFHKTSVVVCNWLKSHHRHNVLKPKIIGKICSLALLFIQLHAVKCDEISFIILMCREQDKKNL